MRIWVEGVLLFKQRRDIISRVLSDEGVKEVVDQTVLGNSFKPKHYTSDPISWVDSLQTMRHIHGHVHQVVCVLRPLRHVSAPPRVATKVTHLLLRPTRTMA